MDGDLESRAEAVVRDAYVVAQRGGYSFASADVLQVITELLDECHRLAVSSPPAAGGEVVRLLMDAAQIRRLRGTSIFPTLVQAFLASESPDAVKPEASSPEAFILTLRLPPAREIPTVQASAEEVQRG